MSSHDGWKESAGCPRTRCSFPPPPKQSASLRCARSLFALLPRLPTSPSFLAPPFFTLFPFFQGPARTATGPTRTVRFLFRKTRASQEARISEDAVAGWTLPLRQQPDCAPGLSGRVGPGSGPGSRPGIAPRPEQPPTVPAGAGASRQRRPGARVPGSDRVTERACAGPRGWAPGGQKARPVPPRPALQRA